MTLLESKRIRTEGFYMKSLETICWWQFYQSVERRWYFLGWHVWTRVLAKCDRPLTRIGK